MTKSFVSQIHKNTVMVMNTLLVYRGACSPIQHWCQKLAYWGLKNNRLL